MKKKIAYILTVWDAPNYGSFLQAIGTKKFLESNGYEVKFLLYRKNKLEQIKFLFEKKKQLLFHPIFSLKRFWDFYNTHRNVEKVKLTDIKNEDYDCLIIGSDELWNLKNDKYFSNEYFYGKGFDLNKVIVYSMSSGTSTYMDFKDKENLKECIKNLKNVSVRDKETFNIVSTIKETDEIEITCDPTFLIDSNELKESYNKKLPEKYILVYSYRIDEKLKNNILKLAKEKNLKTVSVCNNYSWCDYNLSCTPMQFSDIINKATYCVITTFHGSIFSIFNHKKFISVTTKQKTVDLLMKLNLLDRQADEDCEYELFKTKIENEINYDDVEDKINEMKKKSVNWLSSRLKEV